MKVIELLNKIANGEIEENIEYKFSDYDYCTIKEFFNRYVVDKWNLNLEIIEEEKKIPERLPKSVTDNACSSKDERLIANTINEIIDILEMLNDKIK